MKEKCMDTGYMISTNVQIDVSDQPVMCGFKECASPLHKNLISQTFDLTFEQLLLLGLYLSGSFAESLLPYPSSPFHFATSHAF